jgi:hypothetical protein
MFLSRLFDGRSSFGIHRSVNKAIERACATVIDLRKGVRPKKGGRESFLDNRIEDDAKRWKKDS